MGRRAGRPAKPQMSGLRRIGRHPGKGVNSGPRTR